MGEWRPYFDWDLTRTSILPDDWIIDIVRALETSGKQQALTGATTTSTEQSRRYNYPVAVVTGDVIKRDLPWLHDLYATHLLRWASKMFGQQLYIANDLISSININRLSGTGAKYEWHTDTNPVTGLLFVTSSDPSLGGELEFSNGVDRALVWPKAGLFLAFDAQEIQHRVSPLLEDVDRVSVPMNYYSSAEVQHRPDDLNAYLYGAEG